MTRIFCDIADTKLIREFNKKKIVKGFTTNPSLMRKAGAKDYTKYSKKILKITKKPISFEVFADDPKKMILQGEKISNWSQNVFVKVPITNSKGKFMGEVIKTLNKKKIKLNVTAIYTSNQTKQILKNIDKKTKVIISIFAGRMADAGKNPIKQFKESLKLSKKYKNVQILWASTREPYNYLEAKTLGCHIITAPPEIIRKIEKFGKSFEELTIDTVKGFLEDTKKSKFKM
ncbi:transaldolase [Candidatus Pelagibacter sp.]|nr:transaldolase [Candidatus Pelagibacter sp.]